MIQILTLISLWCGFGSDQIGPMQVFKVQNACRKAMIECLKLESKTGMVKEPVTYSDAELLMCAKEAKTWEKGL